MSKVIRSVKNVTKGYSSVQVKVRDATSNDPWGPTGTQMGEIAQLTYNTSTEFYEIMDMLDKRLNDKGKNWRHVLKALKVLDYCLHEGSELVVTWGKQNIYIIKTLREFIYIDEEGRDVGQNIRVAAKELTSLLLNEERLRAERTDRRTWKSRVGGLDDNGPPPEHQPSSSRRREPRRQREDENDTEYKLALEASKHQEEEDRKRRESRQGGDGDDDDLAKAIKLSKEEEDRRRRELEESNATSLFDDTPTPLGQQQPQYTGFNQGYQQGNNVDFLGNPIDQNQMQQQQTGYMNNMYTGFDQQQTGYQNGFNNGFQYQQHTGYEQQPSIQSQPTGMNNPYAVSQASHQETPPQPGNNNPWSTGSMLQTQPKLQPTPTGSNNPFAPKQQQQPQTSFNRPSTFQTLSAPTLSPLPEQKTLSTFQQPQRTSFTPPPQQSQRELSEHEMKLNALLAGGDGLDTFGNTGNLRIPAQHTAPGTFVNSAGAGLNKVTADATGNNPFLRQQYTGMPNTTYGASHQMPAATGPVGMGGGGYGGQGSANPFGARPQGQQQSQGGGDLIQF